MRHGWRMSKVGGEGSYVSMDGFCDGVVVVKLTQNRLNE